MAEAKDLARKTGAAVLDLNERQPGHPQPLIEWAKEQFGKAVASSAWVRQADELAGIENGDTADPGHGRSSRRVLLSWQGPSNLLKATITPVMVLQTGVRETLKLGLKSRGRMSIDEATRLAVDQLGATSSQSASLEVGLQEGRVFCGVEGDKNLETFVEIRMRPGKVAVKEAEFFVETRDAETLVAVFNGGAEASCRAKPEETVTITAGFMATISLSGVGALLPVAIGKSACFSGWKPPSDRTNNLLIPLPRGKTAWECDSVLSRG